MIHTYGPLLQGSENGQEKKALICTFLTSSGSLFCLGCYILRFLDGQNFLLFPECDKKVSTNVL